LEGSRLEHRQKSASVAAPGRSIALIWSASHPLFKEVKFVRNWKSLVP
jgi:hypothetical protein